jgi:voltage-gated potassium channel
MLLNQQRIMTILNKGSDGDQLSRGCDFFLSVLIILNLIAVCLESVESINTLYHTQLAIFETVSVSIFVIEYSLRIWSVAADEESPATTATGRRGNYIFSFTGIIDLLAILPSILPLLLGGMDLRWLRVLRLVRLFKISHYSSALEDLFSAIYQERRSFFAALYLMGVALFLSSSLMYLAEFEAQPEKFASIPQTMWWALITLTTVGYGDVYPITPLGQAIGAFTALLGVCTVALLTGIVASAFSNQMARREAIFEAEVAAALSDGVVTDDEQAHIEILRERFKITEEHARAIFAIIDEKRTE